MSIPRHLTGTDSNAQKITLSESDLRSREEPIIVLGDAGMGKTTLLQHIGEQDGYIYVTARKLVRSNDPSTLLGDATTLVIDALDEVSVHGEGDAVDKVLEKLESAGHPKFILACRVADWRSATSIQTITDDYGNDPLELFLEPISRADALNLLSNKAGETRAQKVIEHFEAQGLEELFGNPQTLKLIQIVANDENLPTSRTQLFEFSVQRLWAEHSHQRLESPLSRLSEGQALNTAGGAFAALILAGKRALSRRPKPEVDEADLPAAEISAFTSSTSNNDLEAVLESRLLSSNIAGSSDRFSYTHRSVGEFLAARWLASRADTEKKRRRLLNLFHGQKLVPASLRGVHAWLARDSHLAPKVIVIDPMGVVEYGDPSDLSDENARTLLLALLEIGRHNPHHPDFDGTRPLRGIARVSLFDELKDFISSESTPRPLRMMLLRTVAESAVAGMLATNLEEMLLDPKISCTERRLAGNALTKLESDQIEWGSIFSKLYDLCDACSLECSGLRL